MTDWRPISTAPTTAGSIVDLWVVPGKRLWAPGRGKPYRIANARLNGNNRYWLNDGEYVEGLRYRDDLGHECFDPHDRGPDATIATHWMPVPEPPETT